MIHTMMRQGFEREVAYFCLQQVKFRSIQAAEIYIKQTDPMTGKKCHAFFSGDDNLCMLCHLPEEHHQRNDVIKDEELQLETNQYYCQICL